VSLPPLPEHLPSWPVFAKLLYSRGKGPNPGPIPNPTARRWFNQTLRPYAYWRIDEKGLPDKRPRGLQQRIPPWALEVVSRAATKGPVTVVPAAPAPARPPLQLTNRYSALMLASKGVLSTWAPLHDNKTPDPAGYATRMAEAGCVWFAPQLNDKNLDPAFADLDAYVQAARARGLQVGAWEQISTSQRPPADVKQTIDQYGLRFLIVCVEGPVADDEWPSKMRTLVGWQYPLTLLLTGGGRMAINHEDWRAVGFGPVMTESYVNENPQATPSNEDFQLKQLGWPPWAPDLYSLPCVGVYWGYPLASYKPMLTRWGDRYSVYCGETMKTTDWAELGR
jgi:hypothetical protein